MKESLRSIVADLNLPESFFEKLLEAGYDSVESVAVASPLEIKEVCGVSEGIALKIVARARESVNIGSFLQASELFSKNVKKIPTGIPALDAALGGGLSTAGITALYGSARSGKTQLAFTFAVGAQIPQDDDSRGHKVIFIDADGTFIPERIKQIAEARGLNGIEILKNIFVARPVSATNQVLLGQHVENLIKEHQDIGLIIVDSLMTLFRWEFPNAKTLAMRQQMMAMHLNELRKLAGLYGVAVVITDRTLRGNLLSTMPYKLHLKKRPNNRRILEVYSPETPESQISLRITEAGVTE